MRAWLLRHEGTLQPRRAEPPLKGGIANGGYVTETMIFGFARSSPDDRAGVVVSYHGALFVREIK